MKDKMESILVINQIDKLKDDRGVEILVRKMNPRAGHQCSRS